MIPHEYIEELTRRTDIVELVGGYVQLKRKGRLYGGLCPFHSEKTPSFYVYPDTQSFYCFGCGAGGDAVTFTKKINSIDYVEAVKLLAQRAGMPEPTEDDKTGRLRSRILTMNKDAARFFHACLNSTVEEARQARAYWRRRGLDDKTINRFGLGYAPDDGQALYQHLRDKGYNQQELDASGLFKRSQSGRIYCLFWRRVMTPIFDLRGNIIAFGGRVLDDSKPKYVNSPETLVYHKSDTVFALQIAKRSASHRYVLCEGYMDVISMHQAGIDTAVCACGTALTPDQIKLISQYADEVILSYDSDEAGQKATLRSLELFRNSPGCGWACCRSRARKTRTSTSRNTVPTASKPCWTAWAMRWTSGWAVCAVSTTSNRMLSASSTSRKRWRCWRSAPTPPSRRSTPGVWPRRRTFPRLPSWPSWPTP